MVLGNLTQFEVVLQVLLRGESVENIDFDFLVYLTSLGSKLIRDLIVWIPPTPPYIFYPLSTPKNWEEWALGHPLKKLKMHTQLG